EALPLSDSMLVLLDLISKKESPETYDYRNAIANLYNQTGQYNRALDMSLETLTKFRKIFPRHFGRHSHIARIAMTSLEKMGRLQEASELALLINQFSLDELREIFSQFSEDEQMRLYHTFRKRPVANFLQFALRHPEFVELAAAGYDYQMTV